MYCLPKSILEHDIGSSSQSALPTISLLDFLTLLIPPLHLVYRWSSKYSTPLSSVEKHSKDLVFSQNSVIFLVSVSFAQNSEVLLCALWKSHICFCKFVLKTKWRGRSKNSNKIAVRKRYLFKRSLFCMLHFWMIKHNFLSSYKFHFLQK